MTIALKQAFELTKVGVATTLNDNFVKYVDKSKEVNENMVRKIVEMVTQEMVNQEAFVGSISSHVFATIKNDIVKELSVCVANSVSKKINMQLTNVVADVKNDASEKLSNALTKVDSTVASLKNEIQSYGVKVDRLCKLEYIGGLSVTDKLLLNQVKDAQNRCDFNVNRLKGQFSIVIKGINECLQKNSLSHLVQMVKDVELIGKTSLDDLPKENQGKRMNVGTIADLHKVAVDAEPPETEKGREKQKDMPSEKLIVNATEVCEKLKNVKEDEASNSIVDSSGFPLMEDISDEEHRKLKDIEEQIRVENAQLRYAIHLDRVKRAKEGTLDAADANDLRIPLDVYLRIKQDHRIMNVLNTLIRIKALEVYSEKEKLYDQRMYGNTIEELMAIKAAERAQLNDDVKKVVDEVVKELSNKRKVPVKPTTSKQADANLSTFKPMNDDELKSHKDLEKYKRQYFYFMNYRYSQKKIADVDIKSVGDANKFNVIVTREDQFTEEFYSCTINRFGYKELLEISDVLKKKPANDDTRKWMVEVNKKLVIKKQMEVTFGLKSETGNTCIPSKRNATDDGSEDRPCKK